MNLFDVRSRSATLTFGMLIGLFIGGPARAQDANLGLVANFEFDGNLTDTSPNQFQLSPVGGTTRFVSDRHGRANRAIEFVAPATGDDTFLKGTGPTLSNRSLTVAFWIRKSAAASTGVGVFGLRADGAAGAPGNNLTVFLDYAGASARFTFWFDDFDIFTPLPVDRWHHLVFTYDHSARSRAAFINGVPVATKPALYAFSGGNTLLIAAKYCSMDGFRFYNRALSAADVATLYSAPPAAAPQIAVQPVSQTVAVGQTATFAASVTGGSSLTFQWRKDGNPITGATAASFTLQSAQPWHIGDYSVTVTSTEGTVTSAGAPLDLAGVDARLWRGLVAYFPFNGSASDVSLSGAIGTVQSAVPSTDRSGIAGRAYAFDGIDDQILTSIAHLPVGAAPRTLSLWAKAAPDSRRNLVGLVEWGAAAVRRTFGISGQFSPLVYQAKTFGGGNDVSSNQEADAVWRHLVATYGDGILRIYVDGVLRGSSTVPIDTAASAVRIGVGVEGGNHFSGLLDDVRIYQRALTGGEIAALYASEIGPTPPTIDRPPAGASVPEGRPVSLSVAAGGTPPLFYQWRKDGTNLPGATDASLTIAVTRRSDFGAYSVIVTNAQGAVSSAPAQLTVLSANPGRIANLSIRTSAGSGNSMLIVGFVAGGRGTSGRANFLARAGGPALAAFGVSGVIPDPVLNLFEGARLVASNDNWVGEPSLESAAGTVGAFAYAPDSRDAAFLASLGAAGYTLQVFDTQSRPGITLVEVYDTGLVYNETLPRLINVSARSTAGSGDATLIAGFVIRGETPLTVLLRGIGPALAQFGVSGALANPRLTLFRDSTVVSINDNWSDLGAADLSATASSVGAFALPPGSLDAALLASLAPGSYTLQLTSTSPSPGVALLEVYEVASP